MKARSTLGSPNQNTEDRAPYDFYSSDPIATHKLYQYNPEWFHNTTMWECACGNKAISKPLEYNGVDVYSSDIIERDYKCDTLDFLLEGDEHLGRYDIITNPPFKAAVPFIERAIHLSKRRTFMLLRLLFLEGIERGEFFRSNKNLKYVLVFSRRIQCLRNDQRGSKLHSGAMAYAWFVWDNEYDGKPQIDFI